MKTEYRSDVYDCMTNSIEIAEAKSKMDENAKQLLANKQVLSWIFKHTVEEFRDYEYEEIENCIEGEIFFDVRCYAITKGKERVKLILNIEAQKSYHLTHPWILRALFYCARMVSEQKDTEFRHDDYGDLKKVYSIWLFMESPKYAAHTISSYAITHNNLYGDFVEERGIKKGLTQGIKQGANQLGELITVLLKEGLTDIVALVAKDEEVREEYYKKYNIE